MTCLVRLTNPPLNLVFLTRSIGDLLISFSTAWCLILYLKGTPFARCFSNPYCIYFSPIGVMHAALNCFPMNPFFVYSVKPVWNTPLIRLNYPRTWSQNLSPYTRYAITARDKRRNLCFMH